MRHNRITLLLTLLVMASQAPAGTPEFIELIDPAPERKGFFGFKTSPIYDVSGDSQMDIAVGARGRLILFDGVSGDYLRTIDSIEDVTPALTAFPAVIAGLKDMNGNGHGEILAASVSSVDDSPGEVLILDGSSEEVLLRLRSPKPTERNFFGRSLVVTSDITGDLISDYLIGETGWDHQDGDEVSISTGAAHLFNGSTGELIRTLLPPDPKSVTRFGSSVAEIPDTNGDGVPEFAVGNPSYPEHTRQFGRVFVYDGSTGSFLYSLESSFPSTVSSFGASLAGLGDINGNGSGEIVVGTSNERRVYVFDGLTKDPIQTYSFNDRNTTILVIETCDVDSDGVEEILLSDSDGGEVVSRSGSVIFINPTSGDTVLTLNSPNPMGFREFGSSASCLCSLGTIPRKGVIVGARFESAEGNPENSGRAYFFPLNTSPFLNNRSDINSDGRVDDLDLMILMEDWGKVSGL